MNDPVWPLAIILSLLLVNAFFVAAEFAIAAVPPTRLARLAEDGSSAARMTLTLLRNPPQLNRYLSTAQVGITIASLGLGMYGEHAVADWLLAPLARWEWLGVTAAHTIATVLSVALLTYLHVVIGESVPKSLALAAPDTIALRLAGWMRATQTLFHPLTTLLNWLGDRLLRLVGIPPADAHAKLVSSIELEYIVEESTEEGLLDPAEQLYLENVLDFGERSVGQVMTPRTRMITVPLTDNAADVLQMVLDFGYSRYPVYHESRDNILGFLHVKDLARHLSQGTPFDMEKMLRPVVFVPETVPLESMLQRFRREHIQVAMVVDEFGGIAGLVTLEDLVEELIGEIQDEFDEEIPPLFEIAPHRLRVRGDLLIAELNQLYELDLADDEADTVAGLVLVHLGHLPAPGESVRVDEIEFIVESVEGMAVNTLIVELPTPPAPPDETVETTVTKPARVLSNEEAWTTST